MSHPARARVAHIVDPSKGEILDVLGPTIQLLTEPEAGENAPCIMRGTIPPGGVVPLHSHPDPETFLAVSGEMDGLAESAGALRWIRIRPGEIFHVPSGAKHAFRNRSRQPAVSIVISTGKMGRFFREVGTPVDAHARPSDLASEETIRHFLETAARFGYWNATPEENARVGLSLPPAS